jgi:methyl-accepting chemotaxis protein
LIPILSVLLLSLVLISVTSYSIMRESTYVIVRSELKNVTDSAGHQMLMADQVTVSALEMMNQKNIALAKALTVIIAADPASLSNAGMTRLCELFGVAEVHVTDEKGVLLWGSVPDFFGLDFYTNEQTLPLTVIIDDPSRTIAQELQPRAVDGMLFQYITVSRLDQPGIVQVGVEMRTIDNIKSSMSIQNASAGIGSGNDGGVFVVDSRKIIVADSSVSGIGVDLSGQYWIDTILLVDGIDINREIMIALLSPTLIEVDCAANGLQAVEMFRNAPDKYGLDLYGHSDA